MCTMKLRGIEKWIKDIIIIGCMLFLFPTVVQSGEIQCRYYSDHNQQENIGQMSDLAGGVADLFSGGVASAISGIATGVGLGSHMKNHKIYCIYKENNENQANSNGIFYNLIKNGDVIPVFLYENMLQKKVDPCQLADINTPFLTGEQRDKGAKADEFVFTSQTAVSDIKYFGFIQPKSNNIIMYAMNPKTLQLREPTYKQWKEINESYLK